MAASYPSSVKTFSTKATNDVIQASHMNDVQDEITAIENALLGQITHLLDISGAGAGRLKFPATQNPSSDVNTLDDYEEGTWTPTITSTGGGTPTYSLQNGFYTKVGREVHVHGRITLATAGTLAAGNLKIAGLPFTTHATAQGGVSITYFGNLAAAYIGVNGFVDVAATTINLYFLSAAAASMAPLAFANITGTLDLIFHASYTT